MVFLISTVENPLNGILSTAENHLNGILKSDNSKPLIWYSTNFTAENHQKGSIISTPQIPFILLQKTIYLLQYTLSHMYIYIYNVNNYFTECLSNRRLNY